MKVKGLDAYRISLKSFHSGVLNYEYELRDDFFKDIVESEDICSGDLSVKLTIKKLSAAFEFDFNIEGVVTTGCDRCLEDVEVNVQTDNIIIVKFGESYSEEDDKLIVISEDEGEINVAWLMYEFIMLSLPTKIVHEEGECNEEIMAFLNEHLAVSVDEDADDDYESDIESEDREIDPRWNELKKILDNN